ncbi:MAG: hypothetical protein AAF639_02845, partial [Chloroflexota bacterium]
MSFSTPTIRKFFREQFSGDNPIHVEFDQLKDWEAKIRVHLKDVHNIRITKEKPSYYSSMYNKPDRNICRLSIQGYREDAVFDLEVNEANQLQIETRYGRSFALISDLDELTQFIAVCLERFERRYTQRHKTRKIRDLTEQGFSAQVAKAAEEDDFEYYLSYQRRGVYLGVYLSDQRVLEFKLSRKQAMNVLPNIRAAVQAAIGVEEQGLNY